MNALVMPARPRGLIGRVRADGENPNLTPQQVHAELMRAVTEMRSKIDEELGGFRGQLDDVVRTEEIDRINASISDLETALRDANNLMARVTLGAGAGGDEPQAVADHAQAFDGYFRRGVEGNLSELQVQAELTTQSDPDGGFLVPRQVETEIMQQVRNVSVMRQLARVRQANAETWTQFVNMGGATGGWVGEEEERPETETPTLREIVMRMMEVYAQPVTTQRMLDFAIIDVGAWLGDEVAETFMEMEGEAFATGNGHKRPKGLFAYDTVANTSWKFGKIGFVKSGHASGFKAEHPGDAFIDLYYALKQGYRRQGTFLMNDVTMNAVRKFKDGQGNYIWAPPQGAADVPTILNRPAQTDDFTPGVEAGAMAVAFGDFDRAYMILDVPGVMVIRDPITTKGKVKFYTTKYVTGGVTNFQAMKFMKIAA